MRYAHVYNSVYRHSHALYHQHPSLHVMQWIQRAVHTQRSVSGLLSLCRHLDRVISTQRVARHIPDGARTLVSRTRTLAHLGFVTFVLIPLQRRVLARLWAPGGRMYHRCLRGALITPTQGATDAARTAEDDG